jgi:transposase
MTTLNSVNSILNKLYLPLLNHFKKNLTATVPGIKAFSAIAIISEIGVDMSVFPTAKHLCSWAGLTPQNNESAGKKKSVRISRAGVYIKPLLVQCANAVVTSEKHPEIRNRYLSIRRRRGHKRAIIAIARLCLLLFIKSLKKANLTMLSFTKKQMFFLYIVKLR